VHGSDADLRSRSASQISLQHWVQSNPTAAFTRVL
jgi:hypothetical protein